MNKKSDLLVVGAGPVGLFTAFYAGMRNLSVTLIDSLPEIGGQPKALYPQKNIFDIPVHPRISGEELTNQLFDQVRRFADTTDIRLEEEVQAVEKQADGSFIVHSSQSSYHVRAVIIAAGNGSFKARKVKLAGADQYEGLGLDYFISDYQQFIGKTVAVCGGGDSALDTALGLRDIADQVYLIHRRDGFRAHEHSVSIAKKANNISFLTPYVPIEIVGNGQHVTGIQLQKGRSDDQVNLEVDQVIMAYGFTSSIGPIKDWGLDLQQNNILVNENMQTSIPGIFAVGDIVSYPGKTKLIVSGFGEAPTAINAAFSYIHPDQLISPVHSSTLFEGE
ncbi:hypothetical protein AWM75_06895 [Aerococcus urinaehominis]|uniref:Ferredoxin--NADP reductase n=1 Tax=Aerococcus urinaehominis TaxID=128944 RepID=A0A109RGZ3_9LACT|nr:NAD(P)/FAD-dependent oxidoreductase [Aerococcus urinaehominis]AMB99728.1 hypothetical protein AWM75_06895 [Aerococcus urinaehominis]SDL92134.1 thioredoxin reductase (NADPH) [Aerococcus urinaehominis]